MATATQQKQHELWLAELTAIPTAAGREHRVVAYIEDWVKRRKNLKCRSDKAGNLIITKTSSGSSRKPLFITAHLDHPAFVVRRIIDNQTMQLDFRGGVHDPYFENARIDIFDENGTAHRGMVIRLDPQTKPFKRVAARLNRPSGRVQVGDIGRWAFDGAQNQPRNVGGQFHSPACDDLAGVAAALAAMDLTSRTSGGATVSLLFTRAEEIGFIGATAACKLKSMPKTARLICLENSRSYPDSPIGHGPIVRVGDKLSVFSGTLTDRITQVVTAYTKKHPEFKYQRKLMPGGSCEATTFAAYGFDATCLCLPLGNYHNMVDADAVLAGRRPARTAPEFISLDDFHGLVDLLVLCAKTIDSKDIPPLRQRMDDLYKQHEFVLASE